MKRRRELYASQPPEALKESRDSEDRGECLEQRFIYIPEEIFSLSVEYGYGKNDTPDDKVGEATEEPDDTIPKRRFLRCPAAITVSHLKKFIRNKYGIPSSYQVDIQYQDESLQDDYTLIDVAYIYAWRRSGPMKFFYRIMERPPTPVKRKYTYTQSDATLNKEEVIENDLKKNCPIKKEEDTPVGIVVPSSTSSIPESISKSQKSGSLSTDGNNNNTNISNSASTDVVVHIKSSPPPVTPVSPAISEHSILEKMVKLMKEKRAVSSKTESKSKPNFNSETKIAVASVAPLPKLFISTSINSVSTVSCTSRMASLKVSTKSDLPTPPPKVKIAQTKNEPDGYPVLKLPKLTLPLVPKVPLVPKAEVDDDKIDILDQDFYDGPLVIAEPEISGKEQEEEQSDTKESKLPNLKDREDKCEINKTEKDDEAEVTDGEADSGRGSDVSSRAEGRSLCGDDDIGSPGSSTARTPDLEKPISFLITSPSPSLPAPSMNGTRDTSNYLLNSSSKNNATATNNNFAIPKQHKDDFGALDLSTCHRKRGHDRLPLSRPRPVANPPVLDKHRQTTPCLPLPKHPSFKLLPAVLPHTSIYKKPEVSGRNNFRCKGSTLTVINPDPNSCRPKIVIKNLDPRPDPRRHHHHHHHNHHHHQRM